MVAKARVEAHLRASGLPFTVIAPGGFFENMLSSFAGLKQGVVPGLLKAGTQMQMVAASDVGAFVRAALEAPDAWLGRRLDVAGDTLTSEQQAATLSRLRGGEKWRVSTPPAIVFYLFIPAAISSLKKFLETKQTRADVEAARAIHPELLSFEAWALQQGLHQRKFDAPSSCAVA